MDRRPTQFIILYDSHMRVAFLLLLLTFGVTVHRLEAAEAPTNILMDSIEIPSTARTGSFVATIEAEDVDSSDTHEYALVSGSGATHNSLFRISGDELLAQANFSSEVGNDFSIRIRVTDIDGLSFERSFTLTVVIESMSIVINEIHYDPDDNLLNGEFIEIYNSGVSSVNLAGWRFDKGIDYTFPNGARLAPGAYIVLAKSPATIQAAFGVIAHGPWSGNLNGDGEEVRLLNGLGETVDQVDYKVGFPWPVASSGEGSSMELLHHLLDNDLGSSWRASPLFSEVSESTLLGFQSTGWSWRAGDTEASMPVSEWRQPNFVEDGSWAANQQLPIGYGDVTGVTLNTTITGMRYNYGCIFLRNTFVIAEGEIPSTIRINSTSDDGMVIWINGVEVERKRFDGDALIGGLATNQFNEGTYEAVTIQNAAEFLVAGNNTITVQVFNTQLDSSDLGFDIEVVRPAQPLTAETGPSPGQQNRVFTSSVAPNIRQVDHSPQAPSSSESVVITAKVTDPEGVDGVELRYQTVMPGAFVPSRTPRSVSEILANPEDAPPLNDEFENPANWTHLVMVDNGTNGDSVAGDNVYTVSLPAQAHRTLVRYRIQITDSEGTSALVPYEDDASLNFAYFVYNGVPDYTASTASVHPDGAGHVWPKEAISRVPVYHWLIRPQDMQTLQAYEGSQQFTNNGTDAELAARRAYDWEGAMVYDGVVYDHVRVRLRGGNSRYGDFDGRFHQGKRHYKFKFNKGYYFAAHNNEGKPYKRKWSVLNVSRMYGTKGGNAWGLTEKMGERLYRTMGVPVQKTHWFQFRVVDDASEAPDQYGGDFWGIQIAQERYDVRFLESRDMTKGNLYKLSDFIFDADRQRRYQSSDMVSDGSEFDNIRFNLHGGQTANWLEDHVNYDQWYRYSAVGEAIRHYDIFPEPTGRHRLKNVVWYFDPVGNDPTRGQLWQLPYDYDASWGPSFNEGWDHANNGLYGHVQIDGQPYIDKPDMKIAHRNVLRSFRDLVWQPDQINNLLDHFEVFLSELSKADQDRWRNAPSSEGTANDDPLSEKVTSMKGFAFTGWNEGSGPGVGDGGRASFLDSISDALDAGKLPVTPSITYTGAAGFPTDALQFQSSVFSDPQGNGTFSAMEWRIGEIEDPLAPSREAAKEFILENDLIWGSGELTSFNSLIDIPNGALKVGHTYRARVRHKDSSGRWGHWSLPVEFTAGLPLAYGTLKDNLMVSEFMYHPADASGPETAAGFSNSDFEYIELHNISETLSLDLMDVRFTKGVDFDFSSGSVTSLGPKEFVLVVKNTAAFTFRYGSEFPIAGEWDSDQRLSNGGEQIKLSFGSGTAIHDFIYSDNAPWPTSPDGDGSSLTLIRPETAPDHTLSSNWRASHATMGTPGFLETEGPFASWMATHHLINPLGDTYISDIPNIVSYALGLDIVVPASSSMTRAKIVEIDSDQYSAISFNRRIEATDASYQIEVSDNLEDWDIDPGDDSVTTLGAVINNGDGTEEVTIRLVQPMTEGNKFLRLRISVN